MDALSAELTRRFDGSKLIGYLNFSDGRPDARTRRMLADVFEAVSDIENQPKAVGQWLKARAQELRESGSAAYRDVTQALLVIEAVFHQFPEQYRSYHGDLLAHNSDDDCLNAFSYAMVCEAILKLHASGIPTGQLARAAVPVLSDYVGYRPVATLENGMLSEVDPHERVMPVPLYLAGSDAAPGRYAEIVLPALALLRETDPFLLDEAMLNPKLLDELALDPRAVDHLHPINKRPNFLFGEWDPHRIDGQGYYRRFIVRQLTIDSLIAWIQPGPGKATRSTETERRFESAAVLAGTILMGAGICGSGPTALDSEQTLGKLVPRIARYRDAFYRRLLDSLPGSHGERLREEATRLKQPFAAVRQFLNQSIAAERALHLQERRLSIFFAAMGYPQAARDRAAKISAPSVRMMTELRIRQTEIGLAIRRGGLSDAADLLHESEDLLRRGIACGAFVDPWSILGYQGLYPIFSNRDDTVKDPRTEELIHTVGRQFDLYAQLLAAATTNDQPEFREKILPRLNGLAEWWDQFASSTVADLPRVHGGERAEAATHVSHALGLWRKGGAGDTSFWRRHLDGFKTPSAFAQVIDALITFGDYRASMALLATWLSEANEVPLQDPSASFVRLAFRWLKGLAQTGTFPATEKGPLLRRFFELLEVNADDRWIVPGLRSDVVDPDAPPIPKHRRRRESDEDTDSVSSAYEGMTYRDTTDDGNEGSIDDGAGPRQFDFPLETDADRLEDRLRFLAAVARLWRSSVRLEFWPKQDATSSAVIRGWLDVADGNLQKIASLLSSIESIEVPHPIGGVDGTMEFDRRKAMKGHLLDVGVGTMVETAAAARALSALLSRAVELPSSEKAESTRSMDEPAPPEIMGTDSEHAEQKQDLDIPAWESLATRLDRAILMGDADNIRAMLPAFELTFKSQPLLVHPTSEGGSPLKAATVQTALQFLQSLLARLPKLGLVRETYRLVILAWAMERNAPPSGRRVSSFDQLFKTALITTVESILSSLEGSKSHAKIVKARGEERDVILTELLKIVVEGYHKLWLQHSQSIRLSAIEAVIEQDDWARVRSFVKSYGDDLLTGQFLTLSNIRGILRQGVAVWMDQIADPDADAGEPIFGRSEDPKERPRLAEHWKDNEVDKIETANLLETVLQALVEHYDEYRDYNTTTTQSDYGENLHILLDFLRLKVAYQRYAWRLSPWHVAHDVLCKRGYDGLATSFRNAIQQRTKKIANDLLKELSTKETELGLRLRTVRDRLEERFVQPLQIDRAAARVSHAAAAARDGQTEEGPAFRNLIDAIAPLAEIPTGVGLDVPAWIRRLEDELRQSQISFLEQQGDTDEIETDLDPSPPPVAIDFDDLRREISLWEDPFGEEE
jgi:hypothetical protein